MPVQSLDTPQGALAQLIGSYGTVRKAAKALGISIGTAARAAKGIEPKRADLRKALHLPPALRPDIIVMGSPVTCRCGRTFIGRWGNRRRTCPVCRPPRKIRRG